MPRIGITGHVHVTDDSVPVITAAIREALKPYCGEDLTGVSCLAPGADTIFASAILELGGRLEAVVPAHDYAASLDPADAAVYRTLLDRAQQPPLVMNFEKSGRKAYAAANRALVRSGLDCLFAVWDGRYMHRRGTTGSVVRYATKQKVAHKILWPDGAKRGR